MQNGIFVAYSPGSANISYVNCTAYNCNWGGAAGDIPSGASTPLDNLVGGCYFHDWENWDSTSDVNHHNGFYAWAESGGRLGNVTYSNNFVGPNLCGSAMSPNNSSSGLFISGAGATGTYLAFNNVFLVGASGDQGPADGLIFFWPGPGSTSRIYNNTFLGINAAINSINAFGDYASSASKAVFSIQNNIFSKNTAITVYFSGNIALTSDHNVYSNLNSAAFNYSGGDSGGGITYAAWAAATGGDKHSLTATPNLNAGYVPQPTSSAINSGASMAAYFAVDKAGLARPQGTAWCIGAFEYPAAGGPPPPPPALPVITSASGAGATVGTAFTFQVTGTNSPTSFAAIGLPAGFTIGASTGL